MVKVNWKTVKSLLGNCLTHRYHATLPILRSILIKDIYNCVHNYIFAFEIDISVIEIQIYVIYIQISLTITDICN